MTMNIHKTLNILTLLTEAIAVTVISLWIGKQAYSWLPPQAAAESQLIDDLISFLVTLGAFFVLFYRLSGQEDILVGCPLAVG